MKASEGAGEHLQFEADESIRLSGVVLREYLVTVADPIREMEPEDLKVVFRDLFRLELNLSHVQASVLQGPGQVGHGAPLHNTQEY